MVKPERSCVNNYSVSRCEGMGNESGGNHFVFLLLTRTFCVNIDCVESAYCNEMNIKKRFKEMEKLYHYTSFETAKKIIETNCLRFGVLSNMNDLHENDKMVFVGASDVSPNNFPTDVLDALHNEIYMYRQISLTADGKKGDKEGFDLHQMWGLYAEKGDGVCLVFDKNELEKKLEKDDLRGRVSYDESVDSFHVSLSNTPNSVGAEVKSHAEEIFFHKRKEWEHEQEYRLLRRCPVAERVEYLSLGHALRFVILSSKLRDTDEVLYFKKIEDIKNVVRRMGEARNVEEAKRIPVLVYGNGLLKYSLCIEDGEETLRNSNEGCNVLVIGENCKLDI